MEPDVIDYRVAVDVGGTFTDVFGIRLDGDDIKLAKVPSTPDDPSIAVVEGIKRLGIPFAHIKLITHGTTVGTNALLTRNLPEAALITTKGFRDILEMRDSTRTELWDAYWDMPKSYIKRRNRFEVRERIDFRGIEEDPINEADLDRVIEILKKRRFETVGVCLYNSYANGDHERQIGRRLSEELSDTYITLSSDIIPEIGEFPRVSTTAINTVLAPVLSKYMDILKKRLEQEGYLGELLIVHSGGGVMPVKEAAHYAARFAASGLAGGAVAMQEIAEGSGYLNAIGLDVGGTSTDVSLISNGELLVTQNWTIEPGYPIRFPSIEVATVGAGGGSIAWRDDGGSVRNGPLSAGADPGPACYSKGGNAPTNTDARLVLGHLGENLAGAAMQLDAARARKAIDARIAGPMGWSTERAALAIIQLADNNIVNAVRIITVQKGYDPRDFVLVAFGGSGPLHAVAVAQALSIPTVLVPPHSGITSAFGCSLVNMRHDATRTYLSPVTGKSVAAVKDLLAQMESEINTQIAREGIEPDKRRFSYFVTLRYVGQWRSLELAFQLDYDLDRVLDAFAEAYESAYSYSEPSGVIEFVGCRVEGTGLLLRSERLTIPRAAGSSPVPSGQRHVLFTGCSDPQLANLYDRTQLLAGQKIMGPAVILEMDSTTLLPPGVPATVDVFGNLIITLEEAIQ